MSSLATSSARIDWLDTARAYGIFLVFYGHIVDRIFKASDLPLLESLAFSHFRFIYSFHMVLFFIISGFFSKETHPDFLTFIKEKLKSRLLPAIFFEVIILPFYILFDGDIIVKFSKSWMFLATGFPIFNILVWFIICLFMVELIHFFISRFLKNNLHYLISIVVFFTFGWHLTARFDLFPNDPRADFWFICEAIFVYSFYQMGSLLGKTKFVENRMAFLPKIILFILCFMSLLLTFDLNNGPWRSFDIPAVLINLLQHGNPFFFIFTAIAGSFFIFFLAQLTPSINSISFIGRNTLILMGLNGFFFHFFNWKIAQVIAFPNETLPIFLYSFFFSILSLLICTPFIMLLNKYLPQFVGKSRVKELPLTN